MYTRQITHQKKRHYSKNKKEEKMIDEFNYLHKESVHFQTVIKSQEIVKTSCCTKEWKVPLTERYPSAIKH